MLPTLGLRHIALNVTDPQRTKAFYTHVLGMTVEWEPDPENIYLTNQGHDNLAIHKSPHAKLSPESPLDHIGFALPSIESVDEWYAHLQKHHVPILRDIKTHRDGARSFYFQDPDGVVVQMIYHPPIANRA